MMHDNTPVYVSNISEWAEISREIEEAPSRIRVTPQTSTLPRSTTIARLAQEVPPSIPSMADLQRAQQEAEDRAAACARCPSVSGLGAVTTTQRTGIFVALGAVGIGIVAMAMKKKRGR